MTKKEKAMVLEAVELIHTKEQEFSCIALDDVAPNYLASLRRRYSTFIWNRCDDGLVDMFDPKSNYPISDDIVNHRVMALLFFMEAEQDFVS